MRPRCHDPTPVGCYGQVISVEDRLRAGEGLLLNPVIGEGPATNQGLSLQDILIARQVGELIGLRIGMINTSLGGGFEYYPNDGMKVSTDLYKINNNPNYPKLRLTSAHEITDFMDITLRADDILNFGTNYSVGVRVKSK